MDNIDKIEFAMKVVATGCCICALALAAKTYKSLKSFECRLDCRRSRPVSYKSLKSFEADDTVPDEQTQHDIEQIDNNTDIQKESDQTNN